MQDTKDQRAFTIVERYEHESVSAHLFRSCFIHAWSGLVWPGLAYIRLPPNQPRVYHPWCGKKDTAVMAFIFYHENIPIPSLSYNPQHFTIYKFFLYSQLPRSQSQKYHLSNPYWQTFDKYVLPLLDKPMDLRRLNELDTSSGTVRVETDEGMWESVKKHQSHRIEQGSY